MKELDVFRYLKKYREDRTLYEHNLIDTDYNGYVIEVFSSAPASSSPAVQEQLQGEIASLVEKISSLQAIYYETNDEYNEYLGVQNIMMLSSVRVTERFPILIFAVLIMVIFGALGCAGAALFGRIEDFKETGPLMQQLETHDLTFAFGPFLLYLLLHWRQSPPPGPLAGGGVLLLPGGTEADRHSGCRPGPFGGVAFGAAAGKGGAAGRPQHCRRGEPRGRHRGERHPGGAGGHSRPGGGHSPPKRRPGAAWENVQKQQGTGRKAVFPGEDAQPPGGALPPGPWEGGGGMEPVISVVVPVYNGAGYLEACFASLAAQTYRRIEVIAVDDASTDKSGALCDRWAEKDPRFQAVHLPENRGPSGARNEGVRRAKGECLSFVDADDFAEPQLLERMYRRLTEAGADVCACGAEETRIKDGPPGVFSREEAVRCLARSQPFGFVPWGKLYRTALVKDCPFDEGIFYSEDLLFFYQLLREVQKIGFLPDRLYRYTTREGSLINSGVDEKKVYRPCRPGSDLQRRRQPISGGRGGLPPGGHGRRPPLPGGGDRFPADGPGGLPVPGCAGGEEGGVGGAALELPETAPGQPPAPFQLEGPGPLPPEKGRGGDPSAVCQRSGLLGPCRRHGKGRAGMKGERPPDPLRVEKTGSVTKKAARDLVNFTPFL